MDYDVEESKLIEEIANLRGIILEIKHHLFEPIPQTGEGLNSVNPRSEHKLSNLKDEIRAIKRDLEEIFRLGADSNGSKKTY